MKILNATCDIRLTEKVITIYIKIEKKNSYNLKRFFEKEDYKIWRMGTLSDTIKKRLNIKFRFYS